MKKDLKSTCQLENADLWVIACAHGLGLELGFLPRERLQDAGQAGGEYGVFLSDLLAG